jgi:O-succinylbenzoate synthase
MGAYLAASVADLPYDCGLATVSLLESDITADPLVAVDGAIGVRRVTPDDDLLDRFAAGSDRGAWWAERVESCYRLLAG